MRKRRRKLSNKLLALANFERCWLRTKADLYVARPPSSIPGNIKYRWMLQQIATSSIHTSLISCKRKHATQKDACICFSTTVH